MNKLPLIAATLAASIGTAAAAEPVTLRLAYPSSPNSVTWQQWFNPWNKRVQADSGDTVHIQPFFGSTLANFMNSYDRTVAGVADIAWGVSNSMTGKLRGSTVVELASDYTSRQSSGAMWKLYERGLIASDWAEVKPLHFFVFPASTPSFVQPVTRLDDLKGLKVATITKIDSEIYQLLGATPITAPVTDFYEMVSRRTVSGFVVGWAALQTFKLHEVTSHHLKFEGAGGAGFYIMNKASYEKLPDAAKKAIDKNAGYEASKGIGATVDQSFNATENFVKTAPGHTLASLDPAEKRRWNARIQPVTDKWVAETPNGAAILEAFRAEVAKIKEGK